MTEIAKRCPQCAAELVVRQQKATGHKFLGCSQWPACDHTEPLPHDIAMRRAGALTLPGFE